MSERLPPAKARPTFADWLAAARAGNQAALNEVFKNIGRVLRRRIKQERMARAVQSKYRDSDLMQDVLFEAYHRFAEFRGQTELELYAWVLEITHGVRFNVLRHYLNTAKRDVSKEVPLDASVVDAHGLARGGQQDRSPFDAMARRDESELVRRVMEQLPDHNQLLLYWRVQDGLSFEEIGQRLECDADSARRLTRAAGRRFTEIAHREGMAVPSAHSGSIRSIPIFCSQ